MNPLAKVTASPLCFQSLAVYIYHCSYQSPERVGNLYLVCLPPQQSPSSGTHIHVKQYPPQGREPRCNACPAEALRLWICRQGSSRSAERKATAPRGTAQGRGCEQDEAQGGPREAEQRAEPRAWSCPGGLPGRKDFLLEETRVLPSVRTPTYPPPPLPWDKEVTVQAQPSA